MSVECLWLTPSSTRIRSWLLFDPIPQELFESSQSSLGAGSAPWLNVISLPTSPSALTAISSTGSSSYDSATEGAVPSNSMISPLNTHFTASQSCITCMFDIHLLLSVTSSALQLDEAELSSWVRYYGGICVTCSDETFTSFILFINPTIFTYTPQLCNCEQSSQPPMSNLLTMIIVACYCGYTDKNSSSPNRLPIFHTTTLAILINSALEARFDTFFTLRPF